MEVTRQRCAERFVSPHFAPTDDLRSQRLIVLGHFGDHEGLRVEERVEVLQLEPYVVDIEVTTVALAQMGQAPSDLQANPSEHLEHFIKCDTLRRRPEFLSPILPPKLDR